MSAYLSAVMEWDRRSAVPPLRVGSDNSLREVITFLSCLPGVHWVGRVKFATKRTGGDFATDHALKITCSGWAKPIFRLYYDASFSKAMLYFRPSVLDDLPPANYPLKKVKIYSLFGLRVTRISHSFQLSLPAPVDRVFQDERPCSQHPYLVLGRRMNSCWAEGSVARTAFILFPWPLRKRLKKRQDRDRQRRDPILAQLQSFVSGSMKVYTSPSTEFDMEVLDDTKSLFGLTWVFPWAIQMLTPIPPNCLMTDATFEILAPYILEILHVICANESIPIAIAVFPSETLQSYDLLYSHVSEVLEEAGYKSMDRDKHILGEIPLVSDQGAALHALVKKYALHWLLCHRHLIEKVGSSTQIGDWVARILRCSSFSEFERVRDCIMLEIAAIQRSTPPGKLSPLHNHHIHVLNMMLGLEVPDELHVPARWARWERLGCPTTSNAAESMHAKLNARTREARTFLGRLEIVKDVLFRRYEDRNTEPRVRRRSANRFLDMIANRRRMPIADDTANDAFLSRLISLVGAEEPRANWLFAQPTAAEVPDAFFVEDLDSVPPGSWRHPVVLNVPIDIVKQPELEDATVPLSTEVMEEEANRATEVMNESFYRTGWDIMLTMKRLLKPSIWKEKWGEIHSFVFTSGAAFLPGGQESVTVEHEATWRYNVRAEFVRWFQIPV
jgi:hypothetical protein